MTMHRKNYFFGLLLFLMISPVLYSQTLKLHPDNKRYLEYRGEPVILITSAEHYGAVLNLDFDYEAYLETLDKEGFNYTRIFSGPYIEPSDNVFGITRNTLAPEPGRYLAPWVKEGEKYDLDRFNPAFFDRIRDFVDVAEKHGILVEVTLFSSIYAENAWQLSPFHGLNNINGVGDMDYHLVNTPYNGKLREFQKSYIQKLVSSLNACDNIFFEIQNEPWSDNPNLAAYVNQDDDTIFSTPWQKKVEVANDVSMDWQAWVASIVSETESHLPKQHLIAQNISNFGYDQKVLPPGVSIINFHYALPEAAILNLDIGGVTGLDETGFMPHEDQIYINQAWRFILSGGGLYNNLDYSFTTESASGETPVPDSNPGWGGPGFRKKLSYLAETMREVPFHEMERTDHVLKPSDTLKQYGLTKTGEIYLVFVEGIKDAEFLPDLPSGEYLIRWMNTDTGEKIESSTVLNSNSSILCPFEEDQAVLLIRRIK